MSSLVKFLIKMTAGYKQTSSFWEKLHKLSLYGMNFGAGSVDGSGEFHAITHVNSRINQKNPIILDVGANIGGWSEKAHNIFGKEAIIHCLEPTKDLIPILQEKFKNHPNILVHNVGLSDKDGSQEMFKFGETHTFSSLYDRRLEHYNKRSTDKEIIQLKKLTTFCQSNNLKHIDFLKIDVEGHELAVLAGAEDLMKTRNLRFIQFEFGGTNVDSRTFFRDFWYALNEHYNIYRILRNGLAPIKEYNETLEIFAQVNYLAELKN